MRAIIEKSGLTATGMLFTIRVDELDIEETAKAPTTGLCRKIMDARPDLADALIEVFDTSGCHRMTILSVGQHAKRVYSEGEAGIRVGKWQPFPTEHYAA